MSEEVKRHWNYRIVRMLHGGDESLCICEVFYEDDKPVMRGEPDCVGNDVEDLSKDLAHMVEALGKPVLDDFVEAPHVGEQPHIWEPDA